MVEDYKLRVGEERERVGPFRVECPDCGVRPGMACRKPSGQIYDGVHQARRKLLRERGLAPHIP